MTPIEAGEEILRCIDCDNTEKSLCYTCGRGYSMPMSEGGCEKILYGWEIYDEAKEVQLGDGTMSTKVTRCKFWIPERRRGRC